MSHDHNNHGHHHHDAEATKPVIAFRAAFYFVLILAGLFICSIAFIQSMSGGHEGGHGAHQATEAGHGGGHEAAHGTEAAEEHHEAGAAHEGTEAHEDPAPAEAHH
jgi:hypothetical protein